MPDFEYKVVLLSVNGLFAARKEYLPEFNVLGRQKWELVCIYDRVAYFKRKVVEDHGFPILN